MKTLKQLEQEERNRAIDKYRQPFLDAISRNLIQRDTDKTNNQADNDLETTPGATRGSSTQN